jgi:hypothetical protein
MLLAVHGRGSRNSLTLLRRHSLLSGCKHNVELIIVFLMWQCFSNGAHSCRLGNMKVTMKDTVRLRIKHDCDVTRMYFRATNCVSRVKLRKTSAMRTSSRTEEMYLQVNKKVTLTLCLRHECVWGSGCSYRFTFFDLGTS